VYAAQTVTPLDGVAEGVYVVVTEDGDPSVV
jgi:hypothetical protein